MAEDIHKCEATFARLKIRVPKNFSIEKYKELTLEILLYPGHWISKEDELIIEDESGNKIENVNIETIVDCNFKPKKTSMNLDYIRLEGMPGKIAINEIILYKPSTKQTSKITI